MIKTQFVNVVFAMSTALANIQKYPGLFGVVDMAAKDLPDSAADEIAKIMSIPMTDDDVDKVFAILSAVHEGRYVVAAVP